MLQSDPKLRLPTSDELPDSDDRPVDNKEQNFLPNFLLFLLEFIWENRQDWFFGVDMGIYHTTGVSPYVPVIPDGFLSLGVDRRKAGKSRKSLDKFNLPWLLAIRSNHGVLMPSNQRVRANKWSKFERVFSNHTSEIRYIREIIFGKRRTRTYWEITTSYFIMVNCSLARHLAEPSFIAGFSSINCFDESILSLFS